MPAPDCPKNWDYEQHPLRTTILPQVVRGILISIGRKTIDTGAATKDTRPWHLILFQQFVPPDFVYFAGHYRGEAFRCLVDYEVGVAGDPRVGYPASKVAIGMQEVSRLIDTAMAGLDLTHQKPNSQLSPGTKLQYIISAVCKIFEFFLRVHPYANGNGHTARTMVWALLSRYGYWPTKWTVEPKPAHPYSQLIAEFRSGNCEPLETMILDSLE